MSSSKVSKQRKRWQKWVQRPRNKKKLKNLYCDQEGRCYYCGEFVPYLRHIPNVCFKRNGNHATFEHLKPMSKGGKIGTHNLVMACWKCNMEQNFRFLSL